MDILQLHNQDQQAALQFINKRRSEPRGLLGPISEVCYCALSHRPYICKAIQKSLELDTHIYMYVCVHIYTYINVFRYVHRWGHTLDLYGIHCLPSRTSKDKNNGMETFLYYSRERHMSRSKTIVPRQNSTFLELGRKPQ